MPRILCLAAILTLAVESGWADGPARGTDVTVGQLIERLGSRDFHVRDAASKALLATGPEALPALQKGRSTQDPEVRRRIDELIPPLERTLLLMPKRVTLHMTHRPIRDVLGELSKQTGYKIAPWEGQAAAMNDRAVYSFHFDRLPFWRALDHVCEATGMVLQQNYWGDDHLRLVSADSFVPFNSYDGPFKTVATGFYYNRSNNFAQLSRNLSQTGEPVTESLTINLQVAVEPKLPIIKTGKVKLTVALDDENHSMMPGGENDPNGMFNQSFYNGGWMRCYLQQANANLSWPSKTSRTIKTLRGTIPVTLLADQKPAVVTEKLLSAKGKKIKAGAATFNFEEVSELPGKQYQVRLSVTEDAKDNNPNDWTRIQSLQQRIELYDNKGNKHNFFFNSIGNMGRSTAQFTFTVQPSGPNMGPPMKMVYYAWVLMEHEVAFEFHDLPLP